MSWAIHAGVAIAGTVAGHTLSYWLVYRESAARDAVLARTGHSYWDMATAIAVVATLSAFFTSGVLGRIKAGSKKHPSFDPARASWAQLLLLEWVGFTVVELLERGAAESVTSLLLEPTFALGLALLVLTAGVGAFLIRGAGRVGETTARTARSAQPSRPLARRPLANVALPRKTFEAATAPRAPPAV